MERSFYLVLLLFFVSRISLNIQTIKGKITSNGEVVPFANVDLEGSSLGVSADENGNYVIKNTELGQLHIIVSAIGILTKKIHVDVSKGVNTIDISVDPTSYDIDQIVVTGTKTFKRKVESPVIVNVIDGRQLESVQACNLSEGLNFQSGIRIETDCQTCNYTQLRMNGLGVVILKFLLMDVLYFLL